MIALLSEAEHRFWVIRRLSKCFTDNRDPHCITHSALSIVAQWILPREIYEMVCRANRVDYVLGMERT